MPVVCGFYRFVALTDLPSLRQQLLELASGQELRGTILLAPEGINGTVSGPPEGVRTLLDWLRADPRFAGIRPRHTEVDEIPFGRLKVRLKKEIIALRVPEADPNDQVGDYVEPSDWNALISDPEVVIVDTRNSYEVEEGSFQGALNPNTRSFGEFPTWVDGNLDPARDKKVAMFCTGGIRCEKATALLLAKGFEKVYHLKGGILGYLDEVPEEDRLWQGECFVFDDRRAES